MYDSQRSRCPAIKYGSVREFNIPSVCKYNRVRSQSVHTELSDRRTPHETVRKYSETATMSTSLCTFQTLGSVGLKNHKRSCFSLTTSPRESAPRLLSQIKEHQSFLSPPDGCDSSQSDLRSTNEELRTSGVFTTLGEINPSLYQDGDIRNSLEANNCPFSESVSSAHRVCFKIDYKISQKELNISFLNIDGLHSGASHVSKAKIKTKVELFDSCDDKLLRVAWASSKTPQNLKNSVKFTKLKTTQLVTSSIRFSLYMKGNGFVKQKHLGESVEEICYQNLFGIKNHSILRNKKTFGRALVSMWYSTLSKKLIVTIVRLEGIKNQVRGFMSSLTAPYVTLTLVDEDGLKMDEAATNRAWFTNNPVFKESCLFKLPEKNLLGVGLRLTIKNGNVLLPGKKLGELMFSWPTEKWQETSTSLHWKKMLKNPGTAVDAWHDISYIL